MTALETFYEQIAEILPFSLDSETAIKLYEKYRECKQMDREQHENTWDEAIKSRITDEEFKDYYTKTYTTRLQNETN